MAVLSKRAPLAGQHQPDAMTLSRRDLLAGAAVIGASLPVLAQSVPALAQSVPALAQSETETHGLSAFGDLKYGPDAKHFAYVNPDAPKGGTFSQQPSSYAFNQNPENFNSLNSFIFRGEAPPGIERTFATLMARAYDEPDALYGLAAKAVRVSADRLTYRFILRDEATFHDGSPLRAEDVAFSLQTLKDKGHPYIRDALRDMAEVAAETPLVVRVTYGKDRARDAVLSLATMPIFSKAYYSRVSFDETTLEVPLGSGAYRVARFEAGRFLELERVKDWWGAKLAVSVGIHNFDILRHEFYRDRDVAFEAFKSRQFLFREEFTSRIWGTQYDFPALRDNRVKREEIPDQTPSGSQGWYFNTRRAKFSDPRVREALAIAFDFEWVNKTIMYASYKRTFSYFQNSDMEAAGKPSPEELAVLTPFRGKVPDEVFAEPYVPPVSNGTGEDRNQLRRAVGLLQQAGWTIKDGKLVNAQGEQMTLELLESSRSFVPHLEAFVRGLKRLGVDATIRLVESTQRQERIKSFDFDMVAQRIGASSTPGDQLRNIFGSHAAKTPGSQNLSGIADPVVDALIDTIAQAKSRDELTTACRALDRVLRSGRYWVAHWYKPSHWIAYWDQFGRPAEKPRYHRGVPETWWIDPSKPNRTGG